MEETRINEAKKIGMRIREARIARKMSQADLSEKAQISADSLLRSDILEVSHIYNAELSELLSDCSRSEIDSIMKIAAELKAAFHSHKAEYDS